MSTLFQTRHRTSMQSLWRKSWEQIGKCSILASDFKGSLKAPVGVAPPLDDLFERLMHDPRINVHVIAMPQLSVQPKKDRLKVMEGSLHQDPKSPQSESARWKASVARWVIGFKQKNWSRQTFVLAFQHVEGCNNPVKAGRCRFGCMIAWNVWKQDTGQQSAGQLDRWSSQAKQKPFTKLNQVEKAPCLDIEFWMWASTTDHISCLRGFLQFIVHARDLSTQSNWLRREPEKGSELVLEIFAGSCRFSKACKELGLSSGHWQRPQTSWKFSGCIVWFDKTARLPISFASS